MTIEELAVNCKIPLEKLKCYEKHGLIQGKEKNHETCYEYEDLFILGKIDVLQKAGFEIDEIALYMQIKKKGNRQKQILMLSDKRKALLESIHEKQQVLDDLDYMIMDLKKTGGDTE